MRPTRLSMLVAAALVLGLARWLLPAGQDAADDKLATAVVRPSHAVASQPGVAAAAGDPRTVSSQEDDLPAAGNAFEVKAPPAPPPAPVPARKVVVVVAPPSAPVSTPSPLPQMQVIGTYDDAAGPAVFVATANGTEIGRVGGVLLADFRVTAITRQQVSLVQMSSRRAVHLDIPRQ